MGRRARDPAGFRLADGRPLPPPLTDRSPDGLVAAIEADTVGARVLNGELPLEPHLEAFRDVFRYEIQVGNASRPSGDAT